MLGITCAQIAMLTAQTALFLAGTLPGAGFADRFICALLGAFVMGLAVGNGYLSDDARDTARQRNAGGHRAYNG